MFYKACQNYAEGKVCVWWFKNTTVFWALCSSEAGSLLFETRRIMYTRVQVSLLKVSGRL